MFNLKKLFRSAKTGDKLISSKLQGSGGEHPPTKPPSPLEEDRDARSEVLNNAPAADYIQRKVKELLDSGQRPQAVFAAVDPTKKGLITYRTPEFTALPLFSSPFIVQDYLTATETPGGVVGLPMESLELAARGWRNAGIDSFFFNRCPRCNVFNKVVPDDGLITQEHITFLWATYITIRNWRATALIHQYLGYTAKDAIAQKRASLEFLRDHVACDVPYVHWLIALLAGVQNDETTRRLATANLEAFGSDFVGKTWYPDTAEPDVAEGELGIPSAAGSQVSAEPNSWADSMAKAHLGLLMSFGIELKQSPSLVQ